MSSLNSTVSLLSLLSDATRLRLLQLLEAQELSVAELVRITQLAQPRISTHLRKLKDAHLVIARREGNSTFYRLHEQMPEGVAEIWPHLQLQDQILNGDQQRLEAVLASREGQNWFEGVAGEMERHYSPGRSWKALALGLSQLLQLGEVLDVGAGDGALAQIAAPRAKRWVCLDRSETLLQAAKQRLGDCPEVEFIRGDMHELPFPDRSFDQVLHFHALTYAHQPKRALAEASRVLRPGGQLLLLTLASHDAMDLARGYGHRQAGFSPEKLAQLARECELSPLLCERVMRESQAPHFELLCLNAKAPISS